MGPKRDIVGEWREAARAEGLRFGVSEHVWGSYNWWETNKGADKQGPYAGVPYDGNDPANRDLYFPPHAPAREAWAEQGNEPEEWKREWFLRAQDLIDQHQPDLYYEDGGIPFGRWGRSLVAHYYNQSLRWHAREGRRGLHRQTPQRMRERARAFSMSSAAWWMRSSRGPSRPTPASATGTTIARRSTSGRRR